MTELNFGRILARTSQFGSETAVVDHSSGFESTYDQHLARVAAIRSALGELLNGTNRTFGVLARNSHQYLELWHAALSGGGVINPINVRMTPLEVVHVLSDSMTEVLFIDRTMALMLDELRDRLPRLRHVVLIGEGDGSYDSFYEDLILRHHGSGLGDEPTEHEPCVLMYTGGTTGLPKGVVLSQRAITLVIYRMMIEYRFDRTVRYLNFMPMFHVGSLASMGIVPACGGTLHLLSSFDAEVVASTINDYRISHIGAVPTMLAMILDHPSFVPDSVSTLRVVLYGAAPMPPTLQRRLMRACPHVALAQAYGMTECASCITVLNYEDHLEGGDILGSVGRAMTGVRLEVRGEDGRVLPAGNIGEIHVRCDSVMTEYLNKPAETSAALEHGWYRTGDAGYLDPRGYLFLADRIKDMIVSGGENIFSLEVESAIASFPGVVQVAVIGLPDETWGEIVHAVVVRSSDSVREPELASHARKRLAGYKVPRSWRLQSDPLPMSAAGKVLKRDLRERESGDAMA